MRQTVLVHVYNFIRMSHVEPSRFIPDDFETVQREVTLVKQYGFPGTYALKYDALMDPRYQALLKGALGPEDEISAWWEITKPLCTRAGVLFRGKHHDDYDDRVDSAYSVGYSPEERKKLVDAYMADFFEVFGFYPKTIGSWVLDSVTLSYAAETYGIVAGAICRDQLGTDGFTLWGGYPNGAYYPSRKNEFIPARTEAEQLPIPVFRLLGPDPIYNFEQDVREGLQGVYTLEPAWLTGRDPKWISWLFDCLTKEDALGLGYAQVGQENNFLWENIQPGLEPQLKVLEALADQGLLRVETMADSGKWFRDAYRSTPPMTFQASRDWRENLTCQWYACGNYRLGLLGEEGHLRIRECFLYREDYPSRYLDGPMEGTKSIFDAPPLLFPQIWQWEKRPYIRFLQEDGLECSGNLTYGTIDDLTAFAQAGSLRLTMAPGGIRVQGAEFMQADMLPQFYALDGNALSMEHRGFIFEITLEKGRWVSAGKNGFRIQAEAGEIFLRLGPDQTPEDVFRKAPPRPEPMARKKYPVPLRSPEMNPPSRVFTRGETGVVELTARDAGILRYTLDGTSPTSDSPKYEGPIPLRENTILTAKLFAPSGEESEPRQEEYRFSIRPKSLECGTKLDGRPVFTGNGTEDLLLPQRGSLDYLDGRWRGTLEDWDLTCTLEDEQFVRSVSLGFISQHRGGVVLPEWAELYIGPDKEHLRLYEKIVLPCCPQKREIQKRDLVFQVYQNVGAFRLVAHRYEKMPPWCCYHGVTNVFTMADNLIIE